MPDPSVELVLFVDAQSLASARALYRWLRLLEAYPPRSFRFVVRDINREEERANADLHGITGIPTLAIRGVKLERVVGDLSSPDAEFYARAALARAGLIPTRG